MVRPLLFGQSRTFTSDSHEMLMLWVYNLLQENTVLLHFSQGSGLLDRHTPQTQHGASYRKGGGGKLQTKYFMTDPDTPPIPPIHSS